MTEKIYAYAWFRRPHQLSPGNWKPCTAAQMPQIIKTLRYHKNAELPGAGAILFGSTMSSRYDYIYVKVEVPPTAIEGLEEV